MVRLMGLKLGYVMMKQQTEFCSMFGAFNLREGIELSAFKRAYDAFCEHLSQQGYVHSWRMWERTYHSGYDTRFPEVTVMVEMCFHDHDASLASWDYVEAAEEPLRILHVAVNSKVQDTLFVLYREIT